MREIYFRKDFDALTKSTQNLRQYIHTKIKEHQHDFDSENLRDFIDVYLKKRNFEEMGTTFVDTVMLFFPDSIDTMAVFMRWIVLYITLYPDVQMKIQAEVDQVVGKDRMVGPIHDQ